MRKTDYVKLIIFALFALGFIVVLFTNNSANKIAYANSAGPPAGHTGAPGDASMSCDECHTDQNTGTGQLFINAPQTYVPGQIYQITVGHTTNDQTRVRWGFQLTVIDDTDAKAGNLLSTDAFTQVLDNTGPSANRQYIEHTSSGTFWNQRPGGASWTFNWTAPSTDVGPVTFYLAGNQANGNELPTGDNIYTTFISSLPSASTADFSVSASPSTRALLPGNNTSYTVNLTPSGGFNGQVALSISGLPANANASFNPTPVNINSASTQSSALTVTTTSNTPLGTYPLTITATSGNLQHTAQVSLIVSNSVVNLAVSQTASPNPALISTTLSYRIEVTNISNTTATSVSLTDTLPTGITFNSASSTQGTCSGAVGGSVNCNIGTLGVGANAVVTISVTPTATGQLSNTASVASAESDSDPTNNTSNMMTDVIAQSTTPSMTDASLAVRTLVSGFNQPISMAFLGPNDFLILEKASGKVLRVTNGQLQGTAALDLAVNSASERGLLGVALHPNFSSNHFVYLYWTESSTGVDTTNADEVPLLGNRVDRYTWNGSTLVFDQNLIKLRAFQADAGQPPRGNHNGGVLRFGPDGKLYIIIGDEGRRGLLQNITTGGPVPDDQFGGPEPDDAHLTGVILRLNDDGTTPTDNPFFNAATNLTGQAALNIKKIFAYGIRNSFGMAFDPLSGLLWTQENGDDAFDEINRVEAGFNGGWIQLMGPASRISEFKAIEVGRAGGLQQNRWPPTNLADTQQLALSRLYNLPGSTYTDPEFSWKYAVAPSPIGFVQGNALGAQFAGNMFVGASRTNLYNGYLFRLKLSNDRRSFTSSDPKLTDKVADNQDKFDIAESESLLVGRDFGITTDIQTGPNGNLYIVSLSNNAIYEIYSKPQTGNLIQFLAPSYSVSEAGGTATITVERFGDLTQAASVNFATSDTAGLVACNQVNGKASERCDYATSVGTLRWAAGEGGNKTFTVAIVDDVHVEGNETFNLTLTNPSGANLSALSTATVTITDNSNDTSNASNPIDDIPFFVTQQYIDFLGRLPDQTGFQNWVATLQNCPGGIYGNNPNSNCDRVHVAKSTFQSVEFQTRGYWAYRFYEVAYGRRPNYAEFIPDMALVGGPKSPQEEALSKDQYMNEFILRSEFTTKYNSTLNNPTAYVDLLLQTAGLANYPQRATLISQLQSGQKTHAQVLREIVESKEVEDKFYVRGFVSMMYYGFLRRDPDPTGFQNYVDKLNTAWDPRGVTFDFIYSPEYMGRFGKP
jgi:uncharacterized repeat protein (TIGR01451 family)